MSIDARGRSKRLAWKTTIVALVTAVVLLVAGCTGTPSNNNANTNQKVQLTFSQWWAPEMPAGALQNLIDQFQTQNPNISVKLISAPFASLQTQTISEAASGTLPDVVGLDGAWVNPLFKQGALLNLTNAMKSANYDPKDLASQVGYNGATYMIPVVNFVYPLFTNDAILAKAGISSPPKTWSEFTADAKKISQSQAGAKGWVVPLGTTNPNGVQNDILSWAWASGGSMLKNGKPNLTGNPDVTGAVNLVKDLVQSNAVLPGANGLQETDKVENFINGRVGMMVDSLAHVTTITKGNAKLKFSVSAQPVKDGYMGKPGILTASWGIGISAKSQHPAEAWKLVQFLMSQATNSKLSTLANGFPGNKVSKPDFTGADPHFQQAFAIYQRSNPVNEFTGLPAANQLMTDFLNEFQKTVANQESTDKMLSNVQAQWQQQF
ncbi:ABC transporter substrate-binding protein [Arthrobacter sp. SDTb3-6]|uniref:ABC transporter substrate-binding protein n=1 Tax=Arthrobacter sp. SDTb3-6 TaxID=2713571 RepID=UPI00159E8793|nr:sugar ABC transporter substrate-binding protein [Arthrobacter sp. SDTb3-6]NVM98128.1 sugar ABC transporter substrate-binding protein [Arthrobacter sp. SDTb3-6]